MAFPGDLYQEKNAEEVVVLNE